MKVLVNIHGFRRIADDYVEQKSIDRYPDRIHYYVECDRPQIKWANFVDSLKLGLLLKKINSKIN